MPDSIPKARNPGDVIAGVPVMLGFYPTDSLVLLTLRDKPGTQSRVVGVAARHDLLIAWDRLLDAIAHASAIAINDHATSVLVVLVDSTTDEVTSRSRDGRHDQIVHSLQSALTHRGIAVEGAWATTQITAGSRWWSLLGPDHTDVLPDPAACPLAVAYRRRRGQHAIQPSREHVTDQIRVNPGMAEQVREILVAPTTPDPVALGGAAGPAPEQRRVVIASMVERVDAVAAGAELIPADFADTAIALHDETVRDCMYGLAITDCAEAAQRFWALLARSMPDPDRAEAATLLAFSAYLDGAGALAYVAAEAALASNPDHAIANLLDLALRTGMPPGQVRSLADTAHTLATEIGVDLHHHERPAPPPEPAAAR